MNALEEFPIVAQWLTERPHPIRAAWSTCELSIPAETYEGLLEQLLAVPRWKFDSFLRSQAVIVKAGGGHKVSHRLILGLVLTVVMAEYARREAAEGRFWTPIAHRFSEAEYSTRLFTCAGQPTSLCRQLLEETARFFNLRHIYGHEGHQEWYISLVLQIGFTRRGFQRRLAEWLAGAPSTLAVEMLLRDAGLLSQGFHRVWGALWNYRRGNLTRQSFDQQLRASPWVLPEWIADLARVAKERRHLDTYKEEDWEHEEEEKNRFLTDPQLIWNSPEPLRFESEIVNLAELELTESVYTVQAGGEVVERLLRQPDASFRPANTGRVRLPLHDGMLHAEIVGPTGEVAARQELVLYDRAAEVTLYDNSTGRRIVEPDEARFIEGRHYAIILTEDLEVAPEPFAEMPTVGAGFKAVLVTAHHGAPIRIALDGEVLWEWSTEHRPPVDSSGVRLSWCNRSDDGSSGLAYASLVLPKGWEFRRARKDFNLLPFDEVSDRSWRSDAFAITAEDHVNDVRIQLHLRYGGRPVTVRRRLAIPGNNVFWAPDGRFTAFDPEKPLYTYSGRHDRFQIKLGLPADNMDRQAIARFYWEHAVIEGSFFHRRAGTRPGPLGELLGFGQPLVIRKGIYNCADEVCVISAAVMDTGILGSLDQSDDGDGILSLRQGIDPQPDHQLLIVRGDLSVEAIPCQLVAEGEKPGFQIPAAVLESEYIVIGLFFRGARLGSIWNFPEKSHLNGAGPGSRPERAARFIRLFKFPLLSGECEAFSRRMALENLPAFVAAWTDEEPFEADGVTFEGTGLDDAGAYAVAELMGLYPLALDAEAVDELVETYGGADPLRCPLDALTKVLFELGRLSPRLAADVIRDWIERHSAYFRPGVSARQLRRELADAALGGMTEPQLVEQIHQATKADKMFIRRHLQVPPPFGWEANVRCLLHLAPFRALLTRFFITTDNLTHA